MPGRLKLDPPEKPPLTIDALTRQQSREIPDELLVSYPLSGVNYVDYTSRHLDIFAFRVAQRYAATIPRRRSSSDPATVVALLGQSNFDYLITVLALSKLGHTVLFLSTRISEAAYISLLETTGSKYLLIDSAFQDATSHLADTLPELQIQQIVGRSTYDYEIEKADIDTRLDQNFDPAEETKKIAWVIHSSGSTGLPKPIFQTHGAALNNYSQHLNLRGFITLPLYHAHGISSVFRAIYSGKQIHLYNAALPLTEHHILKILQRYDFEILYGVPYALKLLAERPEGIEVLKKLKMVMFGGSACPDILGDKLVNHGVNLISHYGTTETGQLMTSFRPQGDREWNYVRPPPTLKPFLRWEEKSPGIFELCVLDGWPSKVATNRPDGSYATKDLFTLHPIIPDAWKYYGRLDDTIVLLNGEKVNPLPIEQTVRENKLSAETVVFGNGKPRPGMFVILSTPAEGLSNEEILTQLSPAVQHANSLVPSYAKLSMDMVTILPGGTEYPRTDKGTVIRAAFYRTFDRRIEEAYEATEKAGEEGLALSEAELRQFIRSSLLRLPNRDALDAISIENQMKNLIEKYGVFEKHTSVKNSLVGEFLVVTGGTGSLGAHIVSQLALLSNVKKVYCLVRASSREDARIRAIRSLRDRSVYHTLPLAARQKISALPARLSGASLGLGPEVRSKIETEITGLIHCAWSVNFNLGLSSFEADHIAGARNLIHLCLKAKRPAPASFNFCSSVSAVAGTPSGLAPESLPEKLSYAQNIGYAQSKLVTEHLCSAAAEQTGMKARVLRVGQVIGDTIHGIWNDTEAIPMIFQAAVTIGAVPKLDEDPLWLPVDVVARAFIDISLQGRTAPVTNIVNAKSFHWAKDLLPALRGAGLEFEDLDKHEWVTRLHDSNPDPVANPPIKLLEFFASKYGNKALGKSMAYSTDVARSLSPALAAPLVIDQQLVDKFLRYWMSKCWNTDVPAERIKEVVVVAGPCGAGKSTIAVALSEAYDIPWIEGDGLHSEASLRKMATGKALSDRDRWAWLSQIKATALQTLAQHQKTSVVVTCSALKRVYRDVLREIGTGGVRVIFIALQAPKETLRPRVRSRRGHYMKAEMLDSQFEIIEAPDYDETDIIPIDVSGEKDQVKREVVNLVRNTLAG